MNYYLGKVEWYEEETLTESYLVAANSYEEATEQMCKYYGEDQIISFSLSIVYDGPVLPLNDAIYEQLKYLDLIF